MISYAQNLEDVVLNRIFYDKPKGFYVDVGAHDPTEFSVTRHFYDKGWHGINIEPIPQSFGRFRRERPRDVNLNLAIGARHNVLSIYEVLGAPELSSLDEKIAAEAARKVGSSLRSFTVEVRTLAEICEMYCREPIDFIKIDVEGREKNVILGGDWKKFRPTMLVVESTVPNSGKITNWEKPDEFADWQAWEPLIIEFGYCFVYYDGLNRYYLHMEYEHLKTRFCIPVTPLQDDFTLYKDLRIALEEQERADSLEKEKAGLGRKLNTLENAVFQEKDIRWTQMIQALEKDKPGFMAEQQTLEQKVQELKSYFTDQEKRIFRLIEKNSELYGQVNELEAENKSLSRNIENLEVEKKDLGQKMVDAQMESGRLQNLVAEERKTSGVLRETQHKLSNAQAKIKKLEAQLGEASKTNNVLRETSESVRRELEKERAVPRLSRVISSLFSFRGPSGVSDQASEEATGKLAALEEQKTRVIRKAGVEEEKLMRLNNRARKDKTMEQVPEATSPCSRLTHSMLCSGWEKVANEARKEFELARLAFVPELELELKSGRDLPHAKWAGITHVPARLPGWMAKTEMYKPFTTDLSASEAWKTANGWCQRLFAFSEDHANILARSGIPIAALKYPLPEVAKRWSWEGFEANPEKKIIQVGWWLARMHAIHLLPESDYRKLWVRRPGPNMDDIFAAERAHLKKRLIFFDHMDSSVTVYDDLPLKEYEERLFANIAFAHYYNASAMDFLLQCIARCTPILVNALPAVREYLGDEYPLY